MAQRSFVFAFMALSVFVLPKTCLALHPPSGGFLNKGGHHASRNIATQEVESVVSQTLGATDLATSQQIGRIEASLGNSYRSLPKTASGGLAPRAVRHLVHSYFTKEHGWLIYGLEATGMRTDASAAEMHKANVLQDKAPALVETLLEAQSSEKGLSVRSVAAMVLIIERLIIEESVNLLESVYEFSNASLANVSESTMRDLLLVYLALFRRGPEYQLDLSHSAQRQLRFLKNEALLEPALVDFMDSTWRNLDFSKRHVLNPFEQRAYSFDELRQVAVRMGEEYGRWQDRDCKTMKAHLMQLDPSGSGRVPLTTFHAQETPAGEYYAFGESAERLRELDALEQSSNGEARVLIANYLTSSTNCLPASSYYSICCLQECELLMNELESKVQAPSAPSQALLRHVSDMSSSSVEGPRELSVAMQDKLKYIAGRHGGEVPLHGRLFRQWLHYVFPHECPMPQSATSASQDSQAASAVESSSKREASEPPAADEAYWSEEEVLPLHEDWVRVHTQSATGFVRNLGRMAALFAALRVAYALVCQNLWAPKTLPKSYVGKEIHFA